MKRHRLPTPALDRWRRELAEGQRTKSALDDLWRAACREQQALEHDGDKLPALAARYLADADDAVKQWAARKRGRDA